MSLRIGRVGIDTAASDPETWSESGDITTLSGNLFAGTLANAQTLRQQILGYVNNEWEKTVPVVWSSDTTRTGFYRVQAAKVDTGPSMVAGYVPFSMTLERVQGYAAPLTESILLGAPRTGKPAGVTPSPWWAITTAANNPRFAPTSWSIGNSRVASSGTMSVATSGGTYPLTATSIIAPANWYDGAATISVGGKAIVGRQIPPAAAAWQIDNGLLKVVAGSGHFMDLYIWVAGAWVGPTAFTVGFWTGSAIADSGLASSVTVLRNAPEEVSLRLDAATQIDLTLRRGSRYVAVTNASFSTLLYPGVGIAAGTAMSHIDANLGGNVKTTNDGNGNRAFLVYGDSPVINESLTNGYVYDNVGTAVFDGACGIEVGGTGSSGADTVVACRNQYHAAQSELSIVVAH